MILLDQMTGIMHAEPDEQPRNPEGNTTVIILERDGSLHHVPPKRNDNRRRGRVELSQEQSEPNTIDKLLNFTFDVLGLHSLEVKVYEQQN
ncbi:MAG: hypothetical protein HC822_16760 [Oscillochloris sp.]|nr:hypothetical protein [Oscillochloris sp.]